MRSFSPRIEAALAAAIAIAGCKGDPPQPAPPVLTAPPAPSPVDRVAPNEIPEGAEKAFGFPIPRAMAVDGRFPDAVHARGDVAFDLVSNYVRARVVADRVETGPAKTVFSQATLKASPDRTLRVEVISAGDRTELYVRDVTRPAASDVVKPSDPWTEPGFDPKDRKASSTRFE